MGYKIVVVGGWCGNLLFIVADHLREFLQESGFSFDLSTKNVWENYSQPPACDLILQLMPAYSEKEVDCPIINIRPLLVDRDHPETINRVLTQIRSDQRVQA